MLHIVYKINCVLKSSFLLCLHRYLNVYDISVCIPTIFNIHTHIHTYTIFTLLLLFYLLDSACDAEILCVKKFCNTKMCTRFFAGVAWILAFLLSCHCMLFPLFCHSTRQYETFSRTIPKPTHKFTPSLSLLLYLSLAKISSILFTFLAQIPAGIMFI